MHSQGKSGVIIISFVFVALNLALDVWRFLEKEDGLSVFYFLWALLLPALMGGLFGETASFFQRRTVPLWWGWIWFFSFPGHLNSQSYLIIWAGGGTIILLFFMVARSYGKQMSQIKAFSLGVLSAFPAFLFKSPFFALPLLFGYVMIFFSLNFRQAAAMLLGAVSGLLWAWILGFQAMSSEAMPRGLIPENLDTQQMASWGGWMGLWVVMTVLGSYKAYQQSLQFKVFHRRVLSASLITLVFAPWFLMHGFSIWECWVLVAPFSMWPLIHFFSLFNASTSMGLFLIVNAVITVFNVFFTL